MLDFYHTKNSCFIIIRKPISTTALLASILGLQRMNIPVLFNDEGAPLSEIVLSALVMVCWSLL
jgi:hypothetical protein